jgi:hypothetical protein
MIKLIEKNKRKNKTSGPKKKGSRARAWTLKSFLALFAWAVYFLLKVKNFLKTK